MKPLFSEEYYRGRWEDFLVPVPGCDFVDLEKELEREMKCYDQSAFQEEALAVIRKFEAGKIASRCKELVMKEFEIAKSIERGTASFGMTTESQEISARAEFRKRFEFNCLQLRDFKEKYDV